MAVIPPSELKVGDGASRYVGSDCYPYSVAKIEGNLVFLRMDDYKVVSGSMMDGSAEYEYSPNPDGVEEVVRFRNGQYEAVYFNSLSGRWKKSGPGRVGFGHRRKYYDPHF